MILYKVAADEVTFFCFSLFPYNNPHGTRYLLQMLYKLLRQLCLETIIAKEMISTTPDYVNN